MHLFPSASSHPAGMAERSNMCITLWLCIYNILYYTILYDTIRYYTILYYATLLNTTRHYTILYDTIRYDTILYYTTLHYTTRHDTILLYTILYYTILYLYMQNIIVYHCISLNYMQYLLLPYLLPPLGGSPTPASDEAFCWVSATLRSWDRRPSA